MPIVVKKDIFKVLLKLNLCCGASDFWASYLVINNLGLKEEDKGKKKCVFQTISFKFLLLDFFPHTFNFCGPDVRFPK